MDSEEFRRRGKEMVDYISNYLDTISTQRVLPEVQPGYLRSMLPSTAPRLPEKWDDIMKDVNRAIMPGNSTGAKARFVILNQERKTGNLYNLAVYLINDRYCITHWQHPRFHAYFPAGNSYPSILGDMLSDAIGCVGFSWAASPACTELEIIVLDWLGKMIGLPKCFMHENGNGGGVLQGSASECVLVSLLAARYATIQDLKNKFPFLDEGHLLSKMVAYCSKMAHSCVEKAGMIAMVKMRELDTDGSYSLRGDVLQNAIEEDRKNGLIPFYVCATLGTTSVCSFDNLQELGVVCDNEKLWLHVDAAYAGSAFICPEFQSFLKGVEYANSFNMNPNKWMLVNFDCSTMWAKDKIVLTQALTVDPLYLQHHQSETAIDFRHWGIPLSRRFRSLKLWFVIRSYGVDGLQKYIREHCRLAKKFEILVRKDDRFEVIGNIRLGLVCFRLQGSNARTQTLLRAINMSGKLHMVPALLNELYVIRFAICAQQATEDDIYYAWEVIKAMAGEVLAAVNGKEEQIIEVKTLVDKLSIDETVNDEETEEEFLYDSNIPSIPTRYEGSGHSPNPLRRRNMLVRMISDPKSYNSKVLKSLSQNNKLQVHDYYK